ncbi:MAG: carboxypeptidase regulatory-like domain-containing protein [Planctomycetes bacterium]|nr:carboxypeptidase regulatory-like domain-containing protein [Planctomycetota bacterium]
MNRAVALAAGLSCLVLLFCAAWLFWYAPAPVRNAASDTRSATPAVVAVTAGNTVHVEAHANVPADPVAPANTPPDEAADPRPSPSQPKPDFRRSPSADKTPPLEAERRKVVSALISGRVLDAGFAPVEGADVFCEVVVMQRSMSMPDDESSSLAKVASSAGDGSFVFTLERETSESAAFTLYVSARCVGFAPSRPVVVNATAGGGFDVALTLRAGGSVSGRVVDAQQNAVAGVRVALGKQVPQAERPAHAGEYFEVLTDSTGAFSFENVPQGVHRIGVVSLVHNTRKGPTEAVIGDAHTILDDLVVEVVTALRLRLVEANGAKLHGPLTVTFRENGKDKQRLTGFVTGDGLVELVYPPVGTFEVIIKVEGCFESAPQRLTFSLNQLTDGGTFTVTRDPDFVKQR